MKILSLYLQRIYQTTNESQTRTDKSGIQDKVERGRRPNWAGGARPQAELRLGAVKGGGRGRRTSQGGYHVY